MKRVMKKGMVIVSIYLTAVVCTLLVSNRIHELNSNSNLHTNSSLSINLTR